MNVCSVCVVWLGVEWGGECLRSWSFQHDVSYIRPLREDGTDYDDYIITSTGHVSRMITVMLKL